MPRMRILTASEQEAFDKPPRFDHRERKKFFEFPKALLDRAKTMHSRGHRIGFLVSCGYFRATRRFYAAADFEARDITYVANQLGERDAPAAVYPHRTRQRHQRRILEFYGFAPFDRDAEAALAVEITTMARTHLKPRLVFDRCVDFLMQHRVLVPRAGVLLELIRSGLQTRKTELVTLMNTHLADEARDLLDDLFAAADDRNRYRLTLLKKLSQSTKPTRIKEGIADFETLEALHGQLEGILSILDLGVAGIRYYAGSVMKSRMFQLQQRSEVVCCTTGSGSGSALGCRVLSDPFCNGPAKTEHMVENIDAHHRLGLLGRQVPGSQAGTDDPFVTGHGRFDQGASIVA